MVPGSKHGESGWRDIVLHRKGQLNASGNEVLDTVSFSRAYDPLCYELLFPALYDRWNSEQKSNEDSGARRNKNFPAMFSSWYLYLRENEFSCLVRSFWLMPQCVLDLFYKGKAEKLYYLWKRQTQLLASEYNWLPDLPGNSDRMEDNAKMVFARGLFIFLAVHVGGEQYMLQQLHYIIEISSKIGLPNFY